MESLMKIAGLFLLILALMTFWPLIVFLLLGLIVYLVIVSWKTKRLINSENGYSSELVGKNNAEIIEAEYTEKEIEHD